MLGLKKPGDTPGSSFFGFRKGAGQYAKASQVTESLRYEVNQFLRLLACIPEEPFIG